MDSDPDVTRIVRSWLRAEEHESADRVLHDVLALLDSNTQGRSRRPAWISVDRNGLAGLATALAAVVVVAVVGLSLLPARVGVGGPLISAAPSPSASAPDRGAGLIGLPFEGATPSDPAPGELVLRFEDAFSGKTMWLYADGRLIWSRFHYVPTNASASFIGLFEQRLTPDGVEFLRSRTIATGLFESDLALARVGYAPFLRIEVRNGDRFVGVTWAWRGITGDAPVATTEQASTLRDLNTLLTDQAAWPPTAWADQAMREYVPSEYSICVRGVPTQIEPAQGWDLLPERAQDLLRAVRQTQEEKGMPKNGACSRMTTNDTRTLALILEDAGVRRAEPERGAFWLRYVLDDPRGSANEIWFSFEPVLPHGEAIWLGPG